MDGQYPLFVLKIVEPTDVLLLFLLSKKIEELLAEQLPLRNKETILKVQEKGKEAISPYCKNKTII